jgi:hypothetical protein
MQTFLPYEDIKESLRALDNARLKNQRTEALELITSITTDRGWRHHPCFKLWENNIDWAERIGQNYHKDMLLEVVNPLFKMPVWLGNKRLHATHRSNLLRKKPEFYKQYGWTEPHDLPYYWYGYAKSDQQTNLFITEEEE